MLRDISKVSKISADQWNLIDQPFLSHAHCPDLVASPSASSVTNVRISIPAPICIRKLFKMQAPYHQYPEPPEYSIADQASLASQQRPAIPEYSSSTFPPLAPHPPPHQQYSTQEQQTFTSRSEQDHSFREQQSFDPRFANQTQHLHNQQIFAPNPAAAHNPNPTQQNIDLRPASLPQYTLPNEQPVAPSRSAASDLLSKFLPGVSTVHKMDQINRSPQNVARIQPTYTDPVSTYPSFDPSPKQRASEYIDLVGDNNDTITVSQGKQGSQEDGAEIEYAPVRSSRLRARKPNMSLKALENTENATPQRSRSKKGNPLSDLAGVNLTPVVSKRGQIRQEIADKTAAYRNHFFVEKKDLFLPLLPIEHNYVKKLVEKHERMTPEELAQLPTITPYKEIETQPRGITATMKPYQLSGLSFMMYLHHNVCTPVPFLVLANTFRVCPVF